MLNEHLPEGQLHDELKEFLEAWNWILLQLFPESKTPVFQNKKLLSVLHHSLNIGKYSQKKFRQQLISFAPDEKVVEFAKSCSLNYSSFEETRTNDFRNKLASFSWGNNASTKNFVKIFDYPDYLIPSEDEKFESMQKIVPLQNPFKQLKDFQSHVVFTAQHYIEFPNTKFLIQMPTGAGKTRVAMEIASHFLNKREGRQVIWLADRAELCDQATETFLNVWSHLGKYPLNLYRIWGESEIPTRLEGTSFVVAMYQKIREPLKNSSLKIKGDLIIPDEAHNVLAPTYEEVINQLKDRHQKQTRLVGLTATPGRGSGGEIENEQLAAFFNNRIIGIEADEGVISYLQGKMILARCVREPLHTNINYTLTRDEWKKLSKSFEHEYPDELLERIANDQKRNLLITLRLIELAKKCKHILVFSGSKKQSKLLTGLMIAMNFTAAHVDGESPSGYRKDIVEKFRNGEVQFIFNYGVFTAGFDAPKIDAVVIARPTTSVVLYGQMIGRGMRGPEIDGTEEFQLIDVVDNIITEYGGLDNVYEFFSEYWEG